MRFSVIIAAALLSGCVAAIDADSDAMIATNATECRQVYNAQVANAPPDGGIVMVGPLVAVGGLVRVGGPESPSEQLNDCYARVDAPANERIQP